MEQIDVMGVMREALQWSLEMLEARDTMNSKVHCAPVRWSEITNRVRDACVLHDEFRREWYRQKGSAK